MNKDNEHILSEVRKLVEPIVTELSYEVYYVEFCNESGNDYLRIYIDKKDGKISLSDCESVSRRVSEVLDEKDPIKDPYYLEVSSPGIFRTLFTDEHYKKVIGNEILVKFKRTFNGVKSLKAILKGIDEENVTLEKDNEEIVIPKDKIKIANLEGEI